MRWTKPWSKKKQKSLDLTPYQGEFVAVSRGALVCHDRTLRGIMNQLKSLRLSATVWFNPTPEQHAAEVARRAEEQRFLESFRDGGSKT